jgi:hypothetical protein
MNQRYILFRHTEVFYYEDATSGKQLSLRTKDEAEKPNSCSTPRMNHSGSPSSTCKSPTHPGWVCQKKSSHGATDGCQSLTPLSLHLAN